MPPKKKGKTAKEKGCQDPSDRVSPVPSSIVSDEESVKGQSDEEPAAPILSREDEQPVTKKKRRPALLLTQQQEDEIVDWIKDRPLLYSKGLKEYKDVAKKERLWEEKARELNLESTALLMTW